MIIPGGWGGWLQILTGRRTNGRSARGDGNRRLCEVRQAALEFAQPVLQRTRSGPRRLVASLSRSRQVARLRRLQAVFFEQRQPVGRRPSLNQLKPMGWRLVSLRRRRTARPVCSCGWIERAGRGSEQSGLRQGVVRPLLQPLAEGVQ
jgi:hypothetical protein